MKGCHAARRGNVNDRTAATRQHVPRGRLAGQECTRQVDLHHLVPAAAWNVLRRAGPRSSGVVDQDVKPAQLRDGGRDRLLDLVLVGDVAGQGQRANTEVARDLL
jgi:hypothetical protein